MQTSACPPFNPDFYTAIQGTPYGDGLERVAALTARLARAHGLPVIGSFDPAEVGCEAGMYIDSEHSGPACLRRLVQQIPGLDEGRRAGGGNRSTSPPTIGG